MRFFSPLALTFLLLGSGLSARAQEPTVVRVGVVALRSSVETVPMTEARDRLVKEINQSKPDKKLRLSVKAVAMEAASESRALAEAHEKKCDFVLLTRLAQWDTSSASQPDGSMASLIPVPVYAVTVEYELKRVNDGGGFANGVAKQQDTTSLREILWLDISQVARKAVADIRKGGTGAQGEDSAAENQAGDLPPRREVQVTGEDFCDWLPAGIAHANALRGVCQYAISLPVNMPNFICDQVASRYRGSSRVPSDLITASVRYEDGNDSYSDVKVNGRQAPTEIAQAPGLWSSGEFGSNNLRSIFDPQNQALFEFTRESTVGDHAAWVFTYRIAKQNDPLWRLRAGERMVAPPYQGEVWIDQKTGDVLRFESMTNGLPKNFPMTAATQRIDYERVAFEDGSAFVLPSDFTVSSTYRDEDPTKNVVQLRNYHKFRAKTRMVFDSPATASAADAASAVGSDAESIETELEENNQLYAILREEAVREDAGRLENERRQELDAATVGALGKLAAIQSERQRALVREETAKNAPPPLATNSDSGAIPTFKASVRLVPVGVVLRDTNGRAVGDRRQEDFRLFDDRRPQVITSFSVEESEAAKQEQAPAQSVVTNNQVAASAENRGPSAMAEQDVAYILDDLHSAFEDFSSAKEAARRHIAEMRAGDRAAIVSTSADVQVDFTYDREKLLSALRSLKPHPIPPGSDCPPVDYYMADLMVNKNDAGMLAQAIGDTVACAKVLPGIAHEMAVGKAFEVLNKGNLDSRRMLGVLRDVIRRTQAMPGRRSIVLVSPGFLTPEADMQRSMTDLIDQAIRSDIVVSAIDLRGLYTVGVDASSNSPASPLKLQTESDGKRAQSDAMAELASGTGGTLFQNSNNLDEGFRRAADVPQFIYVLGFSPQKLDGKFHRLKVTLSGPEKLAVQAREGYFAAKPAAAQ